ncbi:MAG TPA: DUF5103 domain-containing protein, partial [Flavobacteriaceae bacterium]|nr:DUF5103 domain-containing protein [Flavobacteriaceae bacterium]
DDLIGDEANYYYKISHFNFDWTPSDLSQNEYMSGFDDMRIKSYKNSFNTLQIYTHYKLTIPNADTRALKVSGNYMLEIYNDQEELIFSRRFIVYENLAGIGAQIKRSRDLKYINTKQIVNFSIVTGQNLSIKNPDQTIHTLLIKNNNLQNSIYDLKPQYRMGNELIYRYDQETAFNGGNEYLYFDSKDVRGVNVHIRKFELRDIYEIYLYTDKVRANDIYTYNPDINGAFLINTVQGRDPKIEAEYTWVHFFLKNDQPLRNGEEIHIYGGFNNFTIDGSTLMTYNSESGLYEGKRLFKQGFYNYKYVLKQQDGSIDEGFISGNFYQTENQYTIVAYYRAPGARYDRVIGVGSANSKDITN